MIEMDTPAQMRTEEDRQEDKVVMSTPRFSISDALKLCGALLFVLLAWARVESAIESINARLDRIERSEAVYVRADVADVQRQTLAAGMEDLKLRLERIEMKLDK